MACINSETRDTTPKAEPWLWAKWGVFCAVVAVSLALRLWGAGRPMWLDEVFTLKWAHGSYAELFRGNITPFMAATAKTMLDLFGSPAVPDELVLRLPHVFFGVATIVALFLLLWKRFGYAIALASALFLTGLPRHIAYSQEARYYAFAMLCSVVLLAAVHSTVRHFGRRPLLVVFLASFLGLFNHLSFLFALGALLAVGVVLILTEENSPLRSRVKRAALLCCAAFLGASCAALPSLSMIDSRQFATIRHLIDLDSDDPADVAAVLSAPGTVPVSKTSAAESKEMPRSLKTPPSAPHAYTLDWSFYWRSCFRPFISGSPGVLFRVAVFLVLIGLVQVWSVDRPLACMLGALLLIHVPFFFIGVGHSWSARYFSVQIMALAVLSGFGISALAETAQRRLSGKWGSGSRTTAVALVLYAAFLYADNAEGYSRRNVGYTDQGQRTISRVISTFAQPGDTVAFVGVQSGWRPLRMLKCYLERDLQYRPALWYKLGWEEFSSVGALEEFIQERKVGSFWVVTQSEEDGQVGIPEMMQLGASMTRTVGESYLWFVGRDTVNLLDGGDFEGPVESAAMPEGSRIAGGARAFSGFGSLEITVPPEIDGDARPMPTFWFSPVRDPNGTPGLYLPRGKETYSLSFMLKCEDVREGKFPSRTVRVMLEGKDASGKPFHRDLLHIGGTRDWQHYELVLHSGTDFPPDPRSFRVGIGNRGGSGTFWLDNVQLERQPQSTPFTPEMRITRRANSDK